MNMFWLLAVAAVLAPYASALVPSAALQNDFIAAHNFYRSKYCVRNLIWDSNLATVASNWANQNSNSHNPNRGTEYNQLCGCSNSVGENIYGASSTGSISLTTATINETVNLWMSEFYSCTWAGHTNCECIAAGYQTSGSGISYTVIGHATQVLWNATARVGCGYSTYSQSGSNHLLVVCDYSNAGNYVGQATFASSGCTCGSGSSSSSGSTAGSSSGSSGSTASSGSTGTAGSGGNAGSPASVVFSVLSHVF